MTNKNVSLFDIIKLKDNPVLSEKYVKYICGVNEEKQYRHSEIECVAGLIFQLSVGESDLNGFIFGYSVPQLNKEFDLLKITNNTCVNIELKCESVSQEKIKKQLMQNKHYLNMLGKSEIFLFTYVLETNKLYDLKENELCECSFSELSIVLVGLECIDIDLDNVYTPKNILVSPLNNPRGFLTGRYLLTENQETIKKKILGYLSCDNIDRFVGLTGGPGTGKTLLIYDISKELIKNKKILFIHSGILCDGHNVLNEHLPNIKIISAKELRLREIKDVDIVVVDEAHRLYEDSFDKVESWVKRTKTICIFSYDIGQKLARSEERRKTTDGIERLCNENIYKLTNKIRTNKEMALFITCLLDLSKYKDFYEFKNVQLFYEPNKNKAVALAKSFTDFKFISYTPSNYNHALHYQATDENTHRVIGQEFDNVCMIIDDSFQYVNNKLKGETHPNPDYIFEKLLYQGLTRVRSKLAIIITVQEVLSKVLGLFRLR